MRLQAFSHQRMLRHDGQPVAPMPAPIDAKLSLANISGVWVGVADQYHSGALATCPPVTCAALLLSRPMSSELCGLMMWAGVHE